MLVDELAKIGYLAMATSTVTMTISRSKVSRPLRGWIANRSYFFGEMINCPYCTSHWVAFIFCAIYQPRPFPHGFFVDWFTASMATVMFASVLSKWVFQAISTISIPKGE